ncbi:MAG TPA: hypothetical protein VN363_04110 [Anaerolineales bacterium]|nr:hypothetical protein [Anaerolineales bacterium]
MDAIEVQARLEASGKLIPIEFSWLGRTYFVSSIGRRWKDSQGQHILVQANGEQVYELLFQAGAEQWWLVKKPVFPSVA